MEALSRMMAATEDIGLVVGFSVETRNNPGVSVSHFLFANDTLIFCWANEDQLRYLRRLFLCFEAVSGLKINLPKFEIVPIVKVEDVGRLASIFGCRVVGLPKKYLSLPLGLPYKSTTIWNGIVETMERKLAGWKRLYLSKGGMITLYKSTLSNLPTYFLSLFPILVSLANRVEKLQ
jgi:hypothetical protein